MDEVEYFRFVLIVFLVILPFVLFVVAFILDKVRTNLYKPLDDDEEEYKLDGLRHFWCENVGACKYPTHDDACHLCFNEWLDNGKKGKTNADLIRHMTDNELADFLYTVRNKDYICAHGFPDGDGDTVEYWKEWLEIEQCDCYDKNKYR